jgi:hypothetical protein
MEFMIGIVPVCMQLHNNRQWTAPKICQKWTIA